MQQFCEECGKSLAPGVKCCEECGARQDLPEGALAGRPDAPWQRFMQRPVSSLLENEVNFFVPLSSIRSVDLVPDGPGQVDELCIHLPGQPYDIRFPAGTAGHIRAVIGPFLGGRLC